MVERAKCLNIEIWQKNWLEHISDNLSFQQYIHYTVQTLSVQ